tara:strand:- start:1960 stop:3111 length:1152 start_codon:yes stop_codon:yes gene_type:complete
MHTLFFLFALLCLPLMIKAAPLEKKPPQPTIKSLYGEVALDNNLVKALLNHPAIKRMRFIDNAGPSRYFRSLPAYSLFDHALGVYVILKRFKRPFKEQLAGMLEPVAHSVFSHQGTLYLRPKNSNRPYYLAAHTSYLKAVGLEPWLMKAGISVADVDPLDQRFTALYKNPPFLSAIEIEMTLRLAYSFKLLTLKEIRQIMDDLRFEEGKWFFITEKSAAKLGNLSLYFTKRYWGAPQNYVVNRWVAAAMKRAVGLGILSVKEIRFGVDKAVLQKLMQAKDKIIHGLLVQGRQPFRFYSVVKGEDFDEIYKPEFRGLNPLVKREGNYIRLTQLDLDYSKRFNALRESFLGGIKIKFKKPPKNSGFNEFNGGSFAGAHYDLEVAF